MLTNVGADTPKRELSVDPPRDGIGAYRIVVNAVNAVNAVNGKDILLTTTAPDADNPHTGPRRRDGAPDRPRSRRRVP